jgi:hypothetical protein
MISKRIGVDIHDVFLRFHKLGLMLGIQILPNHYYSSVADINYLEKNKNIWAKKSSLPGIKIDLDKQVANLRKNMYSISK